jgi:DNA polymerase III sliding clamp (beta) subunit (PCNA family)
MKIKFTNPTGVTARHLNNAVSKDKLRIVMTGAFIDVKNKQIVVTNAHILVAYPIEIEQMEGALPEGQDGFIVPVRYFDNTRYMLDVPPKGKRLLEPEYVLTDEYAEVYFCGELVFRCKYIDGKYPDYSMILPKDEPKAFTEFGLNLDVIENFVKSVPKRKNMTYKVNLHAPTKIIKFTDTNPDDKRPIWGVVMHAYLSKQ